MSDTGDYISREAAIEAMYKDAEAHPGHTFWTSQFESLMDIPAADVRPNVTGRWIDHQEGRWVYAKCSECETVHDVRSNFCPTCGAKMRGESDV